MQVVIRNLAGQWRMKPDGVRCPHLTFGGTKASCAVHSEPWFTETPCHTYGNPDIDPDFVITRDRPCRVGQLIQSRGGLLAVFPDEPQASWDELELLADGQFY